ncbi:hypothetical protein U2F26_34130 [Micromonospora sp. 4G57]|uniref:Uncharacterized protein n=1 Tax=Micromonospora sicca TaxID=2202420 RepID=A0ABU5JP31_9ACTN|nr:MULTISPECIES: hypothetical protein [unclassified Micromonospora]MDZ5447688.1 hypothetical protein [Micromonospora sp. 4G57]MDZ5494407.1 hypothetical protein [Micromonospora sp. 4G53]
MTRYDFAAADHLSQKLSVLAEKIEWLAWLRKSQRSALLGDPSSVKWTGKKRTAVFEPEFHREQSRLTALAAEAIRLKQAVDTATANAYAAKKAEDMAKQPHVRQAPR